MSVINCLKFDFEGIFKLTLVTINWSFAIPLQVSFFAFTPPLILIHMISIQIKMIKRTIQLSKMSLFVFLSPKLRSKIHKTQKNLDSKKACSASFNKFENWPAIIFEEMLGLTWPKWNQKFWRKIPWKNGRNC